MKKTILLSSILAVGAVFAEATGTDVQCDNLIGALDVTIPAASVRKQTLVSVPFLGYDGDAVKVEEMVKTSNLGKDSKLYVANENGGYDTWKLNEDGAWVADGKVTIGVNGVPVAGESPQQSEAVANRGDAFWIEPSEGFTGGKIYLLGQGDTTEGVSTISSGAWNLVGNTSGAQVNITAKGYKVVDDKEVQGYTDGEKICVQGAGGVLETYTYRDKSWRKGRNTDQEIKIAAGQGFWFLSKGTTAIKWN